MTKFFVGQMVRIVRCSFHHHYLGREARITAIGESAIDRSNGRLIHGTIQLDFVVDGYGRACATADQLEPILPEGSAPSEYSFSELMDSLRETVK